MKLLAADYDGTLRRGDTVSQRNKEALINWRKQGNLFGIVTGRSLESIQKEIIKNELAIDFLITNNGGVQADGNGNVLSVTTIDFNAALEIIDYIRSLNCISYVLNNGISRSRTVLKASAEDLKYGNQDVMRSEADLIAEGQIAQIVISVEDNEINHEYAKAINERFSAYVEAFPNLYCVDIVPKGISKAEGINKMLIDSKLEPVSVICVGDQFNDCSMLQAYKGYTFHDSPQELQSMAFKVIDEVADVVDDEL